MLRVDAGAEVLRSTTTVPSRRCEAMPSVAAHHGLHDLALGQREEHDVARCGDVGGAGGRRGAARRDVVGLGVEAEHLDAGVDDATGHAPAHVAESDETDVFVMRCSSSRCLRTSDRRRPGVPCACAAGRADGVDDGRAAVGAHDLPGDVRGVSLSRNAATPAISSAVTGAAQRRGGRAALHVVLAAASSSPRRRTGRWARCRGRRR